ncbi:hypothetical protein [Kitasatospora sp. NPDC094015]|uniref:hypothetical protein n=1 Tax=Kitasatospora sp. NPDC094015 TaxID=3155205 RepID=UPI0033232586
MQDPSQPPAQPPHPPATQAGPPQPATAGPSQAKLWGTAAAVVSAVAGVASAFAAIFGGSSSTGSAPPPPSSVTAPAQPVQSSTDKPSTPAPVDSKTTGTGSGSGAGSVRWTGHVLFGQEGVDLDQVPPRVGVPGTFGLRPSVGREGSSSLQVKGTVAVWSGAEAPTAQGCKELLATQATGAAVVGVNDRVCLVQEHSPIAVLEVTATHYDAGSYGQLEGTLTTWNLRLDG